MWSETRTSVSLSTRIRCTSKMVSLLYISDETLESAHSCTDVRSGMLGCQMQGIISPVLEHTALGSLDFLVPFRATGLFFLSFLISFSFFFFITANYAVPFAQMHKTNYVLSHPQLLFQYKIILCSEVGKFQTPFGFGPMVSGKKGLLVFKSFYNVYKRCALLLSRSF